LELIVRTRPGRVAEVPYVFGERHAGDSKSSVREGLRFLRHLAMLRTGEVDAGPAGGSP
jgi:dolichol-phosphate mannosyltransferase